MKFSVLTPKSSLWNFCRPIRSSSLKWTSAGFSSISPNMHPSYYHTNSVTVFPYSLSTGLWIEWAVTLFFLSNLFFNFFSSSLFTNRIYTRLWPSFSTIFFLYPPHQGSSIESFHSNWYLSCVFSPSSFSSDNFSYSEKLSPCRCRWIYQSSFFLFAANSLSISFVCFWCALNCFEVRLWTSLSAC